MRGIMKGEVNITTCNNIIIKTNFNFLDEYIRSIA